jgi:rifampicin phosphotransferase
MTDIQNVLCRPGDCDPHAPERFGGKACNLVALVRMGQPVPPCYFVGAALLTECLQAANELARFEKLLSPLTKGNDPGRIESQSGQVRELIVGLAIPWRWEQAIVALHKEVIGEDALFAVRSSAADEDAATASFAGLHDSFLFCRGDDDLLEKIRRVWASAFNTRAVSFRLEHDIPLAGVRIGVVVQEMVVADISGVMFTANPNNGNVHEVLVSSLYGAGEGIVSAGLDADLFTVAKSDLSVETLLTTKSSQLLRDDSTGRGLVTCEVPAERRDEPSLSEEQLREVVTTGLRIEQECGRPQDIEFSIAADGRLYVLQTRPLTTVWEYGPAAGNPLVWDNSNIIESYSGPTTPMTFSFIRRAYTIVYHCFAEVMGLPAGEVRRNRVVFENMLGLFHGQVYYNLANWYRLIRLFPGFEYNKAFMESMMGLKEKLDVDEETQEAGFARRYFVELPRLLRLVVRTVFMFVRIRTLVARFESQFDTHYRKWTTRGFSALPPHEIMEAYRELEEALLWNWKAPIVNDFYVMIFYGTLKELCVRWCGDEHGSLQNDLICGEGGIVSTEPTRLLMKMARAVRGNADWRGHFLNASPSELAAVVPTDPRYEPLAKDVARYLAEYGDRCMNELKLESTSLRDRPEFVYQMICNYVKMTDESALDSDALEARERGIRRQAEETVFAAIGEGFSATLRRRVFCWVLRNARRGVKNRENLRFARTRIYGLLRQFLNAIGDNFVQEGLLGCREDIYYLTIDEVWDFIKGTAVCTDLQGLADLRRREFKIYQGPGSDSPDDRFNTYGLAYHRNRFRNPQPETRVPGDGLQGIGCCAGVVTGVARVLSSPDDNLHLDGEILVAPRTDPGWVPLYPAVSGILIERGSILSHSAIVAREMGIPIIVGIPKLLSTVRDGQTVTMDGASGRVLLEDDTELGEGSCPLSLFHRP